jgi:hypothetical protein
VKSIFHEQGQVHQVRYKICTFVNKKDKLLASKLDNLLKHEGCHKVIFVNVKGFFFNKDFVHVKNEHYYTTIDHPFVLDRLQVNVPFEQWWKHVQFVVFFICFPMVVP